MFANHGTPGGAGGCKINAQKSQEPVKSKLRKYALGKPKITPNTKEPKNIVDKRESPGDPSIPPI